MVFKLQRCWEGMRRLCAFFLLLLAVAPCLLTFAASSAAEASLPMCCRAHGRHKCFLRMTRTEYPASNLSQPGISQASERCAYSPTFPLSPRTNSLGQPTGFSAAVRLNIAATTEVASTERSTPFTLHANRKRGPPSPVLPAEFTENWPAAHPKLPSHWRQNVQLEPDTCNLFPDFFPGFSTFG
jgi:hypothetical protein